ncbi:MAG: hypothetical protein AB7G11_11345 [Phycisphaerales bacterium]
MSSFRLTVPIGQLLVRQGVLTDEQCRDILRRQETRGRPFGVIAEEMFGVSGEAVERAWADQYCMMAEWIDAGLAKVDPAALALVDGRRAWEHRMLPISIRGGEMRVCTTRENLIRALEFATRQVPMTCYFVLAETDDLCGALMRHYPMEVAASVSGEEEGAGTVKDAA